MTKISLLQAYIKEAMISMEGQMLFKREQIPSVLKIFDIYYQVLPRSICNFLLWIPFRDDSKLAAGESLGKFFFIFKLSCVSQIFFSRQVLPFFRRTKTVLVSW